MLISLSTLPDEQPASRWGKSPASVNSNAAVKVVSSRQVSPNDFGMLRNGLVMKNALVVIDGPTPRLSAIRSASCKAAENDCLERRNSIRPWVPSHEPTRQSGEVTNCSGALGEC